MGRSIAVRRMSEFACQLLERDGYSGRDAVLVVPRHQYNLRKTYGAVGRSGSSKRGDSKAGAPSRLSNISITEIREDRNFDLNI
jgi:hypothetical protein